MNGPIGARNLWVEVLENPLTEAVQLTFLRAGEPARALALAIDEGAARPLWGLGRGEDGALRECPAFACEIEESGSGVAWLVYGGDVGVVVGRVGDATPPLAALREGRIGAGVAVDGYFIVEREQLVLALD